jgi:hypothetical protein
MRRVITGVFLILAVLLPKTGNAQAYMLPTPSPQVTAANASWQMNGEAVFYEGDFYFPSAPTVYFDGNVMKRVGVYRGVPLYVDATLVPYSVVYLPIGGNVMRPYERKRYGEIVGTVGSRTPWYPIQRDVELSASSGAVGIQTPPIGPLELPVLPEAIQVQTPTTSMVGTFNASGVFTTAPSAAGQPAPSIAAPPPAEAPRPTRVESVPPPRSNAGIWIEFSGARWYSAGQAVPFFDDRFVQIGDYHGFPVYRLKNGPSNEIWVPAVIGGPVAPYRR